MPARRGRRRRRATRSLWVIAIALLVVAVLAGWQLQASAERVRDDLTLAKRLLGQASAAGPASLARREALLQAAQPAITDARAQLRSWPLRQLGARPPARSRRPAGLGGGAEAAEQTTGAALGVVSALTRMASGRLTGATLTATADAFQRLADVSTDQAKRVRAQRALLLDRQRREFLAGADQTARRAGQITQVLRLGGHDVRLAAVRAPVPGVPEPGRAARHRRTHWAVRDPPGVRQRSKAPHRGQLQHPQPARRRPHAPAGSGRSLSGRGGRRPEPLVVGEPAAAPAPGWPGHRGALPAHRRLVAGRRRPHRPVGGCGDPQGQRALRRRRVADHRGQCRQPHAGRGLRALRRRPCRPTAVPGRRRLPDLRFAPPRPPTGPGGIGARSGGGGARPPPTAVRRGSGSRAGPAGPRSGRERSRADARRLPAAGGRQHRRQQARRLPAAGPALRRHPRCRRRRPCRRRGRAAELGAPGPAAALCRRSL